MEEISLVVSSLSVVKMMKERRYLLIFCKHTVRIGLKHLWIRKHKLQILFSHNFCVFLKVKDVQDKITVWFVSFRHILVKTCWYFFTLLEQGANYGLGFVYKVVALRKAKLQKFNSKDIHQETHFNPTFLTFFWSNSSNLFHYISTNF